MQFSFPCNNNQFHNIAFRREGLSAMENIKLSRSSWILLVRFAEQCRVRRV